MCIRDSIHSGDVLLVQGTWNNIARLSKEDSDWVVLGQPLAEAAKVTLDYNCLLYTSFIFSTLMCWRSTSVFPI